MSYTLDPLARSCQIFVNSASATFVTDATKRNSIGIILEEPVRVPEGYTAQVSIVDAQIPVTWATLYKSILVRSNLRSVNGHILARIPVTVANGYLLHYFNYSGFKASIADKTITVLELSLLYDNESDVSFGAGVDWSLTFQIDYIKSHK